MAENPVTVFYDNLSSDDEIFEGKINNLPETELNTSVTYSYDVTKPNVDSLNNVDCDKSSEKSES